MSDFAQIFQSLSPEKQDEVLNGPAVGPPDGITPNFDSPPNQNRLAFAVTTISLVVSSVVVILWLISKISCQKKFHVGDGFIIAGFGIFVGYSYCIYYWLNLTGMYVHTWDIRLRTFPDWLYNVYVGTNLYGSTIMSMKIGILLEWIRIFTPGHIRNTFWWACQVNLVVNVLFYGAAKLVDNLACTPHEKIWNITLEGHCINVKASTFGSSIVNLISDLAILILPQSVIWRLNMSTARKTGLAGIFAAGILGCVAAVFRVVTCAQYYKSTDMAYDLSPVALWDIVEMTIIIIVACLPSLPAIFREPPVRKLLSPITSWTGAARSTSANRSRWHRKPDGTIDSSNRNAYRHINEHSLTALTNVPSVDSHLRQPKSRISEPRHVQEQGGIVRTTDFTAEVNYADANAKRDNPSHPLQHPWMEAEV